MTRGLPRVSGDEVVRALQRAGFVVVSTRGSHCKLRHHDLTVIVPLGRDPLKIGTQADIVRQAGITPDRLQDLL